MRETRKLSNFLSSYLDYAKCKKAPNKFHLWSGISMLAAAVERKIWINNGHSLFPNLYIMLTGGPGTGKSTAIRRALPFLWKLKKDINPRFRILQGNMSDAGLLKEMNSYGKFTYGDLEIKHTSGFYHASEGSSSAFQNIAGDWKATVTELYDCDTSYGKSLKSESWFLENICFNLLAGTTFHYLSTIVDQHSARGGLASRLTFPLVTDFKKQPSKWGERSHVSDGKLADDIFHDLCQIHLLVGEMKPSDAAVKYYNEWEVSEADYFNNLPSERQKDVMTRREMLTKKLMMIASIAESDSLIIEPHHIEWAIKLADEVTKDTNLILISAIIGDKTTQEATTQYIVQQLALAGEAGLSEGDMHGKFLQFGGDLSKYPLTINALVGSNQVARLDGGRLKLLVDPHFNI